MANEPPRPISPNGLWEWDDEAWSWVPRQDAAKRQPEGRRRAAWIAGAILGLAVLSAALAVYSGASPSWVANTLQTAIGGAVQEKAPTPAPSVSAQGRLRVAYTEMMTRNEGAAWTTAEAADQACVDALTRGTIADCWVRLGAEQAAIQEWRHELDSTRPPDCLRQFNPGVELALSDYEASINARRKGLENHDAASLQAGDQLRLDANGAAAYVDSLIQDTKC